jgi:hypothetical protein
MTKAKYNLSVHVVAVINDGEEKKSQIYIDVDGDGPKTRFPNDGEWDMTPGQMIEFPVPAQIFTASTDKTERAVVRVMEKDKLSKDDKYLKAELKLNPSSMPKVERLRVRGDKATLILEVHCNLLSTLIKGQNPEYGSLRTDTPGIRVKNED